MLGALQSILKATNSSDDFIQLKGNPNFYVQPIIRGRLPYQSSTIIVAAFQDKTKRTSVKLKCKWYRLVGDRYYEIPNNEDETYHISPFDIGSYITAIIKAENRELKGKLQLKVGPIKMDPVLRPGIEECIISKRGLFNFKLLKNDEKFIDDYSDYENLLFFEKPKIIFKTCSLIKEELEDFEIDIEGTPDFKIKCENHDSRAVTIYFRRGFECEASRTIDLQSPQSKNSRRNFGAFDESEDMQSKNPLTIDIEVSEEVNDSPPARRRSRIFEMTPSEEKMMIETEGTDRDIKSIRIRFESRMLRDTFIVSLRILRVLRSVSLSTLLYNVDRVIKRQWFPIGENTFDDDFETILFELDSYRETVKRMVEVNKSLNSENDNLNDCMEILENDLEFSVQEFRQLLTDLRKRDLDVDQYQKVEEKLIEKSMIAEKMAEGREGGQRRGAPGRVAKTMQAELSNTKKLNAMLLKEIETLKKKRKNAEKDSERKK